MSDNILRMEATLIGALLHDCSKMGEVAAVLSPEDFGESMTRTLFDTICKLHFAGNPINRVTVEHELGPEWSDAIAEMLNYTTSDVLYYAEMIKEENKLRKIHDRAFELCSAETLADASKGMDALNSLMVTRKTVEVISAEQAAAEFLTETEEEEYLPWGFPEIDKYVEVELGDYIALGGYPSAGKTLLSIEFAIAMAEKYKVGYFSLETSAKKMRNRIFTYLSKVPLKHIKHRGTLTQDEWKALTSAASRFSKLNLDIIEAGGMSVRDIQAVALNKRYQIVFIDYLQQIYARGNSRYEQVTNISQELQRMARVNNIAIIALAQLSRPEKTGGKPVPPSMASFRESGQIEQDADVAFLLYLTDPNDKTSDRIFKIGKNKENECMKMEMQFDGPTQTLTPRPETKGEHWNRLQKEIKQAGKAVKSDEQQVTFHDLKDDEGGELPF